MKITPQQAQLALNAIDAHYKLGMAGGANYGRFVTIFADELQAFVNEEVAKQNAPPTPPPAPTDSLPEVGPSQPQDGKDPNLKKP